MKFINFIFTMSFLFCGTLLWSQIDTVNLESVKVVDNIIDKYGSIDKKQDININALTTSTNLATTLQDNASIYIKQYGVSGLSTISFRGTGASHTSLLWNGFEINMLSTGLTDLNTMSTSVFEKVSVRFGSNVALTSSGSIGGSINLKNFAVKQDSLKLSFTNIFKQYQGFYMAFKASKSYKNLDFFVNASLSNGKNNIPLKKGIYERLPNAGVNTNQIITGLRWIPNNKNVLKSSVWLSNSERQLPPARYSATDSSIINDKSLRFFSDFKHYFSDNTNLSLNVFYDNTTLDFKSNSVELSSTKNETTSTQLNYEIKQRKWLINVGAKSRFERVISNQYVRSVDRWRNTFYINTRWVNPRDSWIFEGSSKALYLNNNLNYALNTKLKYKWKASSLHIKLSSDYKLPSFNDLYWPDRITIKGNPDLKIEKSKSIELGYVKSIPVFKNNIKLSGTTYYMTMDDWIGWIPQNGVISPINEQKVNIYGVEIDASYPFKWHKCNINFKVNYAFSKSVISRSKVEDRIGSFLIYQPQHRAGFEISALWKNWQFYSQHQFTSKRFLYYNTYSQFLDPFILARYSVNYDLFKKQRMSGKLGLSLNNAYDKFYELQQGDPTLPRFLSVLFKVEI